MIGDRGYVGIDRNDDVDGFGLGARFMLNRNFQVDLDLRSKVRESSQAAWAFDDFDKNVGSITVRMQF